jgi:5-methylcytosine-specific restriction endonuclease McrA
VETDRWRVLPEVVGWSAPDVTFDDAMPVDELDALLRQLAKLRAGWDELVGSCAYVVKQSRLHSVAGFTSFRHYLDERVGLPARAVEQRAALEKRLAVSAPLREARRQKVPYQKLRLLARLPDRELGSWIPRAKALTCVDLADALERESERQLRGRGKLSARLPRRVAVLLAAAIAAVRERSDRPISSGKCLAIVAWHFIETWSALVGPRKTRSRRIRERDGCRCKVPGCSRQATHVHHVQFRSRGGGDEPENLVGLCAFHHLRCIHGGWLRVVGRAPDALTWFLRGEPWSGPRP